VYVDGVCNVVEGDNIVEWWKEDRSQVSTASPKQPEVAVEMFCMNRLQVEDKQRREKVPTQYIHISLFSALEESIILCMTFTI
jgi:hypothetical protein